MHSGPVNSIKFNQRPNLFASGSKEIILASINIDRNDKYIKAELDCQSQDHGLISSLSWNDAVPYILAAGTTVGNVYIWDMKKNSLHMSICDPNLSNDDELRVNANIPTYVCWMGDGLSFVMSYDHPDYQFLIQYNVKQPSSPCGDFHGGHNKSIIGIGKNPYDDNYILSLGKDNIVTCWNFATNKPVTQLHDKSGSLQASQILWLNKTPDSFLSAGLDGNIYTHQLNFTNNEYVQHNVQDSKALPPKWFSKKSGINFGFGGKILTFSDKNNSVISMHKLVNNQEFSEKMKTFVEKIEKQDLNEFLNEKINYSADKNNSFMWVALKCYYNNDYNQLFTVLGYDKETLKQETYNYIGKKINKSNTSKPRDFSNVNNQNKILQQGKDDALSFFSEMTNKAENQKESSTNLPKNQTNQIISNTEKPNLITETISKNINWNQGSEKLIKQSLLTGDLESAVDVALKCGREAEALLIAVSSGNQELLNKTKNEYFGKNKDLFIRNIFSSIINKNFEALLDYNVIKEWKEYILYAKTYLNDTKFSSFAYEIAEKLSNTEDIYSAIVCFILAQNFEKCIELLYKKYLSEIENVTKTEKNYCLHNLFEETIAIKYILDNSQNNNEFFDIIIHDYSNLLIDNNLFAEACIYINKIRNKSQKLLTIYDRIYGHCENTIGKVFPKIPPPYNVVVIKPRIQQVVNKQLTNKTNVNNNMTNQPNKSANLWEVEKQNPNSSINNLNNQVKNSTNNIQNKMQPENKSNNQRNVIQQNKPVNPINRPPPIKNINLDENQSQNQGYSNTNEQISNQYHNNLNLTNGPNRLINRPVNPPITKTPQIIKPPNPVVEEEQKQLNIPNYNKNSEKNTPPLEMMNPSRPEIKSKFFK